MLLKDYVVSTQDFVYRGLFGIVVSVIIVQCLRVSDRRACPRIRIKIIECRSVH